MVTQARQRVSIADVEAASRELNIEKADRLVEKLKNLPVRRKAPPPPEGGICLREASRRYGMHPTIISRLVRRGHVPIIARMRKWVYVDEKALKKYLDSLNNGREAHDN